MIDTILKFAIAGFALIFLILLTLAVVRRRSAASAPLIRAGSASLVVAGLLSILAGVIGKDDTAAIACGFMFLVLATGIEARPKVKAKAQGLG